MPRHPIYDFILSITTSNVVWWNKNVKTIFQEVIFGEGDEEFTYSTKVGYHGVGD
jgi:hypothetical protein